jgi:EAL domain-containing protein (putative c-di-GMP-specific phosphodiesterase class I)
MRQLADWHRHGFDELSVAVNISGQWFHDPALIDTITTALADHGIEPHHLHIELTETSILADSAWTARQTKALRDLGIRVAIDDFGAGQTSLSYLHRFSIDTIKIDREFTAHVVDDDSVSRLVGGMIRLLDTMGVQVIAEGVETADQYLHLNSLGAHTGQGYYIARPGPPDDITSWLEHRRRRAHARPTRHDSEG